MKRTPVTNRTRWAAVGAAVAITLGAGGIGIVDATVSSGERTVYSAITSCRLTDTRSTDVDTRATPLQPGETYVLTAHGTNGQCSNIPTDVVAVELNITATDATETTFFTVWGEGAQPNASSLNPAPGQPPTPNAVTVDLSATGTFNIFNFSGTVNAIVDVTGYYRDHNHDDRYYTESEIDLRAPRTQTITVGAVSFAPDLTQTPATKLPDGGAYVTSAPATGRMFAPVALPHGATLTAVSVTYYDNAVFDDLLLQVLCERLDTPGLVSTPAVGGSSGFFGWGTTSLTVSPNYKVANDECTYVASAFNTNWDTLGNVLRIKAFVFTVVMPG